MPTLVKDTPSQSPCNIDNPVDVPPPNVNTPQTVVTENVDYDRNILETLTQQEQGSESNSENDFDERILELLEKISTGVPAPQFISDSIAAVDLPATQLLNKSINNETDRRTNANESESLKVEKARGDLKTRINIRRCVIEHSTESDQDQQDDCKLRHKSKRLLRSKNHYDTAIAKSSQPEFNVEKKKLSDTSTEDETEIEIRKQSLRSQQQTKDNLCVKLKIKLSDLKEGKNDRIDSSSTPVDKEEIIEKKDTANTNRVKTLAEKKKITRASVVDESQSVNDGTKPTGDTENRVSVKSLRSRQRVSYVEAVEEQFATFDSSESEEESLYMKVQEKNKKKKLAKNLKSLVSSTKETQVTENIFDCNVLVNHIQVNQIQIRQNVKFNKKQRSVSCENKDVLINKKSLRSVKSFCRMEDTEGDNKEKSQSVSNLDQITVATQSNPTSSFNNEFIDFLKSTVVVRPEPAVIPSVSRPSIEKPDDPESAISEEKISPQENSNTKVQKVDTTLETLADDHCMIPDIAPVEMAVQTEISDIPDPVQDETVINEETNVSEPVVTNVDTEHVDKPLEEAANNVSINIATSSEEVEEKSSCHIDSIENIITDVINASCNIEDATTDETQYEPDTNNIVTGQTKKQIAVKQTRKRSQVERIIIEDPPSCKKIKPSFDDQPIPFTELMVPEVVLTEDLPVSVNIGTMCEPSNIISSAPESKPVAKLTKHVDTCEKSVSTDVTKIQFSIYPDTTPSTSSVAIGSTNVNKDVYSYFDNVGKKLALYENSVNKKKPNYFDSELNKAPISKLKPTCMPTFSGAKSTSTSSVRSVIQTKSVSSVSSVSLTPMNLSPASASHRIQLISSNSNTNVISANIGYANNDMPMDLSRKPNNYLDVDMVKTKPVTITSRCAKPRLDVQESYMKRSTSTTPDCISYKQVAARDSTTPESVCKLGSSSTTPDSVYSSHETVPRARNKTKSTVYELPRQSPQTMQMMHTRLWDMQELPYHNMLINEHPLPQAQLINAPNLLPMQALSSSEYTAQRNLFIANQMYVSALQAFQDAANGNSSQKSYASPSKKRTDGTDVGRRKKVRDVMTNVPVLSYEQLQQSNIGLERRLEENVFQYQSSSSTAQSTSVIQRTEVSSDQSTLTYVHNTPDVDCPQLPNILDNYSNLQSYGLNPTLVSQIQNLSTNRIAKAKSKLPRR